MKILRGQSQRSKDKPANAGSARRAAAPVALATLLVVLGASLAQADATGSVLDYTGCLKQDGGTIQHLKEGSAPAKDCPPGHAQIRVSGGDITEVVAGTGLTGGGTNGAATLNLGPTFALPQSCASAQVAKWNGTVWQCGMDNDTTYTAGTGLSLNGTAFSLASGYGLPQSCSSGQVAKFSSSWGCGTDNNTTYDGGDFARSDQACPSRKFVEGIGSTGDLDCREPRLSTEGSSGGSYLPATVDGANSYLTLAQSPDVPPGTYLVIANVVLFNSNRPVGSGGEIQVVCRISGRNPGMWKHVPGYDQNDILSFSEFIDFSQPGGDLTLECRQWGKHPVYAGPARLHAVRLGPSIYAP